MSREMVNSGIPWIGEIPKEWKCSSLKYFIDCLDGKRVPLDAGSRIKGEYPYWGAGNIVDYVNDYLFDEELVLLGEDGAPFFDKSRPVAFWVNEKIWANNHIHVLKPLPTVCAKYLVHFLNTVEYKCYINGSILPKLTQGNMNTIPMILPPLTVQQKIASFLDKKCAEIDEMIALQEKIVEELKAYKQSVITEAVTKGLNPDVPMKNSGIEWIGEIPNHWDVKLLSSLFDEHKQKNKDLSETNLLSLSYGKIVRKDINANEGLLPESFDGYNVISKGDIVFRLTDLQNDKKSLRTGLCLEKGIITSAYVTIRARQELHAPYYHYLVHSYDVCKVFYGMGDGVRQGMNYSDLRKLLILSPSYDEQKAIAEYLDEKCTEIDNLISIKLSKIDSLKEYKKSIIYEYVTGKKEVI